MNNLPIDDTKRIVLLSLIDSHILFIANALGGDDRASGEISGALREMKEQLEAMQ